MKNTFYDIACTWRDNYLRKRSISIRVKEEYWDILENRVFKHLGNKNIGSISATELDSLVDFLLDQNYSPKTIKNTFAVIKSIMSYAYRKGIIEENPIEKMDDLPSASKDNKIHFFTPFECKEFLRALEAEPLDIRAYFTIMVYSGFRRGELCAVRWDDIDFENRTVSINRALSRTHGGTIVKRPKTASSARTISLSPCCFELLKQLKMSATGPYVFTSADGTRPVSPQLQTNRFRRILKHYNKTHVSPLPQIRLHDLRHTAATLLISNNVDIETVAKRLGHANPSVTLNIYAHPTLEADYKASDVMTRLFSA